MTAPRVEARVASDRDVPAVAALHRSVFPEYQSSRLGLAFCRRLVARYVADPATVVLVVDGPAGPSGYLVGGPPAAQRRANDALSPWAALAAAGQVVRSPRHAVRGAGPAWRRARRMVGSLLGRARRRPAASGDTRVPAALEAGTRVVLVGVAASARGTGAVDALLAAFVERSADMGHRTADLLVVEVNLAARRAYERNGWRSTGDAGGGTVRFVLDLPGG